MSGSQGSQRVKRKKILQFVAKNLKILCSSRRSHFVALDLLRIISTLWVILVHSYNFALAWLHFHESTLSHLHENFLYQFIANGTFAVDNFFMMSGYLACRRALKEVQGKPKRETKSRVSLFLSSLWSRYARLVPIMMSMILFSVLSLARIDCDAPNWHKSIAMFSHWCSSPASWSLNLAMLHNLINTQTMCFSHSWYLAADFQLFLLFRLMLLAINRRPPTVLCVALIVVAQSVSSSITYFYDLPPMPLLPTREPAAMNEFYRLVYIKPHQWASSYFMGVLLASNFHRLKAAIRVHQRKITTVSSMLVVALVMSNYVHFRDNTPMGRTYATLYALVARPLWSLSVACLLLICAPPLNTFKATTKRVVACLSRLSFAAYLLHPLLMAAFYGSRRETFHFSHFLMLYLTIGNVSLTYCGSILLYTLIELPLQKLLTPAAKQLPQRCTHNLRSIKSEAPSTSGGL